MSADDDAVLEAVLARIGVAGAPFLGSGGEARVYALDADRVVRITHPGADVGPIRRAIDFVADLTPTGGLRLPEVLDLWEQDGRVVSIERRLPGTSLLVALEAGGARPDRARLIESHLDASDAVAAMFDASRATRFGEFLGADPIGGATLHEFLLARARWSLEQVDDLPTVDLDASVGDLPDLTAPSSGCLVHLDAFAGNMMTDGRRVTSVFDFGGATVIGDRWMNPVSTAVYLGVPTITPGATPEDTEVARRWLADRGLAELEHPFRRWLAAYWAFAVDDVKLHAWCRSVLA